MCWEDVQSNRMFKEMLRPACDRVSRHLIEDITVKSGVRFYQDKSAFELKSLNQIIEIAVPEYSFRQEITDWHKLVILHYLDLADGTAVSSDMIPFGSLKGGLVRGTKFDQETERELQVFLLRKTPEQLSRICKLFGAELVEDRADLCARFSFLPRYPVWLKVWFADDEFDVSGKFFVSKSADHYLTIEDAVTVGEILLSKLKNTV